MTPERDPFGRDKAERLTDQDTADRMLATGVRRVQDEGLRISFDLLRFEELIVEASVARSAVYRRWPTKHHYYADLLRKLSDHQFPAATAYRQACVAFITDQFDEIRARMATEVGRHQVAVEMCRVIAQQTYQTLITSPAWKVHLTLTATVATLPAQGSLQTDLQASLRDSEARFFAEMAEMFGLFMMSMGHRLRPALPPEVSLQAVSRVGLSILEGLSLHDITSPEDTASNTPSAWQADPFHAGESKEWTLAGIGFASAMTNVFETNPTHGGDWSLEKIDEHCHLLRELIQKFDT